ncbi:MAG: hypothetical protein KC609_05070, partial [Myxococcales bacterium]|nr:hypothetical protein [Myxococcales bacterium]
AVAALVVVGFRHRERWAWRGATASLLLWFAIESTLSAVHGAWFNIYLIDLMPLVSVGTLLILARGELDVVEAAPAIPREQAFWHHWLFSACVAFTLFGLVSATSSHTALFGFYNRALAQRFFASDELPAIAVAFQRFAFVPLGGTIAGQFVALAYLARYPIRRGERWAIDASIASLLAWFIVDSSVTAYHRAWFNLLMVNLPTLLVMLPPLLVLRQTGRAA